MSVRIAVNGYLFSPGVLTLGVKLILNRIETEFVVPAMRDQAKKASKVFIVVEFMQLLGDPKDHETF